MNHQASGNKPLGTTPLSEILGDPSNPDMSSLVSALNSQLELEDNPSLVMDLIEQLQHYADSDSFAQGPGMPSAAPGMGLSKSTVTFKPEPKVVSAGDLPAVRAELQRTKDYTKDELDEFVRFCKEEEYDEGDLLDDIEVFEEGDSAIIENMSSLFDWNSNKAMLFVVALRTVLGVGAAPPVTRAQSQYNLLASGQRQSVRDRFPMPTPGSGTGGFHIPSKVSFTPGAPAQRDRARSMPAHAQSSPGYEF